VRHYNIGRFTGLQVNDGMYVGRYTGLSRIYASPAGRFPDLYSSKG